jgi:hypothetical protein
MLGRDYKSRLGQLLATLIHNAGASFTSPKPHPIALVRFALRRALMCSSGSAHRPLTAAMAATGAAIRVTPIVASTNTEQLKAEGARAQQKNVGHVLAKRRQKIDLLPISPQGAARPRPCVTWKPGVAPLGFRLLCAGAPLRYPAVQPNFSANWGLRTDLRTRSLRIWVARDTVGISMIIELLVFSLTRGLSTAQLGGASVRSSDCS